jgi:hypothetical protein
MHRHFREPVVVPPPADYWTERVQKGWKLLAVEWERPDEAMESASSIIEVPYGLRIAADCSGLEEEPREMQVLRIVMAVISDDRPLSVAVEKLNLGGFKTREGHAWTPTLVFKLMPRVVEIGPRVMLENSWPERRMSLAR